MNEIINQAKAIKEDLVTFRRTIHRNPEVGATLPKTNNSVWFNDWKPKTKVLMMFGAESSGLSDELKDFANQNLTIEMNKDVESLNLSISAGIVMHKML